MLNNLRRSLVAQEGNVVFCLFSGEGGALYAEIELEAESAGLAAKEVLELEAESVGPAAQEVPELDAVVILRFEPFRKDSWPSRLKRWFVISVVF